MSPSKVGELIPAPHYDPATDIVGGAKPQVQKYIRAIVTAAERLRRVRKKLFVSARVRTATEKLFLLSGLHCAELFTDILSAIQERGEDIEEGLLLVETLGRGFRGQWKMACESEGESGTEGGRKGCESWRMNEKMVPKMSCYELAIKIMIERVEIMREDRPPKDRIEELIEHLRLLYDEEPTTQWYGTPRTMILCVKEAGMGRIEVATSKDVWPPKSFLLSWVVRARKLRFAREGAQASEALIREVNRKVHELALGSGITDKQAVLNIAIAKEFEIKLDGLHAQAFDARNFSVRDRCWRCRITFGFSWLWSERDPSQVKTEEVRDFEGVWGEGDTSSNVEFGMCAEYLLWWESEG
ncbi:hypothetical protein MMC31_003644 [Peltigera leucophlebia]|nr:hypothetical protein [Peltigera leucophlebia]